MGSILTDFGQSGKLEESATSHTLVVLRLELFLIGQWHCPYDPSYAKPLHRFDMDWRDCPVADERTVRKVVLGSDGRADHAAHTADACFGNRASNRARASSFSVQQSAKA